MPRKEKLDCEKQFFILRHQFQITCLTESRLRRIAHAPYHGQKKPVTLIGVLLGYVRGYNRFSRPKNLLPDFFPLRPIVRLAMLFGVIVSWAVFIGLFLAGRAIAFGHSRNG